MWYFLYQQAREVVAERELEADQHRLAYLAAGQLTGASRRSPAGLIRRSAARVSLAVGRVATRVAGAIDADVAQAA